MVDLRERVEEDRGLLKRIQLHIPGFAGYRRKEDLRTADNLLRIQIANKLKDFRGQLEAARGTLTSNYQLKAMEPLGAVILKTQGLEGQVRQLPGVGILFARKRRFHECRCAYFLLTRGQER